MVDPESSQRKTTIKYFLNNSEGQKVQVCKIFFITTLGFKPKNDGVVYRALSTSERSSSVPVPDNRGRHPNKSKIDREIIESFHPEKSYYRREHCPNVRYLPDDLTINFMFKDFCQKHPKMISYELYRKVISELNIHFTNLGHEQCELCEQFRPHVSHNKKNLDPNCETCNKWSVHNTKVRATIINCRLFTKN